MGRLAILTALGPVLQGKEPRDSRIARARTSRLSLRARAPLPVYMDGEYCGEHVSLEARVLPGGVAAVVRVSAASARVRVRQDGSARRHCH
ncbi:MAG: hypothetical protein IPO18_09505 [bacterium]|nr:hypothetical protein [bacterium]